MFSHSSVSRILSPPCAFVNLLFLVRLNVSRACTAHNVSSALISVCAHTHARTLVGHWSGCIARNIRPPSIELL